MLASKKTKRGVIGAVVLAGVLAVSGYAMTDALAVPTTSHAADGLKPVETLTSTNVHYDLDSTTPSNVDGIEFDLSAAVATGGAVYVEPDDGANNTVGPVGDGVDHSSDAEKGVWYSCVITGTPSGATGTVSATHPFCATTGTQLVASHVTQVRVVAAD